MVGGGEAPTGGNGIPRNVERFFPGLNKSRFPGPFNPYPPEYNPRLHGPYDPQRYYGSRKLVCWWDVKLKDLPLEIFKADRSIQTLIPTYTRYLNKMIAKWCRPKHAFPMFPFLGACTFFYMLVHQSNQDWHKKAVHHW